MCFHRQRKHVNKLLLFVKCFSHLERSTARCDTYARMNVFILNIVGIKWFEMHVCPHAVYIYFYALCITAEYTCPRRVRFRFNPWVCSCFAPLLFERSTFSQHQLIKYGIILIFAKEHEGSARCLRIALFYFTRRRMYGEGKSRVVASAFSDITLSNKFFFFFILHFIVAIEKRVARTSN